MIGSPHDIEGLRASLLPYGVVEAISAASTAVRNNTAQQSNDDTEPPTPSTAKIRSMSAGHSSASVYELSV
jgi:hypothetical protein